MRRPPGAREPEVSDPAGLASPGQVIEQSQTLRSQEELLSSSNVRGSDRTEKGRYEEGLESAFRPEKEMKLPGDPVRRRSPSFPPGSQSAPVIAAADRTDLSASLRP